jgi:Zn-dependent protease
LLLIGIVKLLNGQILIDRLYGVIPLIYPEFAGSTIDTNPYLQSLLWIGILINVYLNLFNLLPVVPLDGGQIMREIWVELDPWNGMVRALWASIAVAVLMALFGFSNRQTFMGIFFAYLAISNYQMLQMSGPGGFGGRRGPW